MSATQGAWAAQKENPASAAERTETCPGDAHLLHSAGVLSGPDPEQGHLLVTTTHTLYPPKGLLHSVSLTLLLLVTFAVIP